jgi:3-deoxy-D-manno-octulosonic acid kinase
MTSERIEDDATGAILFDPASVPQVTGDWFDPAFWRAGERLREQGGGRGGVAIVQTPVGECVLRHYRRGGMVARLLGDRYLWTGRDRTRSFREFRLLANLSARGLPVPGPVASRYVRHGMRYRADLIMRRIADASTLAECLADGRLDSTLAARVGELVARFHREGVWHADLNAHNVLVGDDRLHLIDFDRGEFRAEARGWREANLERLRRSLLKLGAAERGGRFQEAIWGPLIQAYEKAFGA